MRRLFIFFLMLVLVGNFFLLFSSSVSASNFTDGLTKTAEGGAGYTKVDNPTNIITKTIGSMFTTMFIGVSFLGLMIYAGFIWMLARGNTQQVEKAKNIIIYAIIGLMVVLSAYVITKLVIPLWEQATK